MALTRRYGLYRHGGLIEAVPIERLAQMFGRLVQFLRRKRLAQFQSCGRWICAASVSCFMPWMYSLRRNSCGTPSNVTAT